MGNSFHSASIIIDGQYNIGHICTRQQCDAGRADKPAMRWVEPNMDKTEVTFLELEQQSNRFANAVSTVGLKRVD